MATTIELMLQPWKKCADFNGRARRKEYLFFFLTQSMAIIFPAIFLVVFLLLLGFELDSKKVEQITDCGVSFLSLITTFPHIALSVRRLHDTGRSGWWLLTAIVPGINLWLIWILIVNGNAGENAYGPDPKAQSGKQPEPPVLSKKPKEGDILSELEKLGQLREKGLLSEEEFCALKMQVFREGVQ